MHALYDMLNKKNGLDCWLDRIVGLIAFSVWLFCTGAVGTWRG
jgi:hypothetical protein